MQTGCTLNVYLLQQYCWGKVKACKTEKLFLVLQTLDYFLKDQTVDSRRLSENSFQICFFYRQLARSYSLFDALFGLNLSFLQQGNQKIKIKKKSYTHTQKIIVQKGFLAPPQADGREVTEPASQLPSPKPGQTSCAPESPGRRMSGA